MKNVLAFKIMPGIAIPPSRAGRTDFVIAVKYWYLLLSRKSYAGDFMRFYTGKYLKKQSFSLFTAGLICRIRAALVC